jgi:hypothetical protein
MHIRNKFHRRLGFDWAVAALLCVAAVSPAAEPTTPAKPVDAAPSFSSDEAHSQEIQHWIERLGDEDYFIRRQAQAELAKYGFEAFDALTAATASEDLEIAARARYLLRLMRVEWTAKDDPPQVKKLLTDYDSLGMSGKLSRLEMLAELPDGVGLPILCRLVRYEKSPLLSKYAAKQVIARRGSDQPLPKELFDRLRKDLQHSRRAAGVWLLTWLRFQEDPEAAVFEWAKLVEAEQALLRSAPSESKADIVAALVRFEVGWLKRLGHTESAVMAMRRLVALEEGDAESLAELFDWLVQQKAWKVVDELADRFAAQVQQSAILLYCVAEAQAAQGRQKEAEGTAQQAFKLNSGKDEKLLAQHWLAADYLRQHGLFAWAEREYRHLIAGADGNQELVQTAYLFLAEMFHDQENDLEAAKLLDDLLARLKKQQKTGDELTARLLAELSGRRHYFYACHFKSRNDATQQEQHLRKAVESGSPDIDALIAVHQLANQTPEQRQKLAELIKKAAADVQEKIDEDPSSPKNYNEYAWLVGNTDGDLSLALKYAQKSVELSPRMGGYYDTLAHVYFHQGDYENAVKQQARAADLDPHSGLVRRQLKFFRAKLEEQQKKSP